MGGLTQSLPLRLSDPFIAIFQRRACNHRRDCMMLNPEIFLFVYHSKSSAPRDGLVVGSAFWLLLVSLYRRACGDFDLQSMLVMVKGALLLLYRRCGLPTVVSATTDLS